MPQPSATAVPVIGTAVEELQQQLASLKGEVVQRRLEQLRDTGERTSWRMGQLEDSLRNLTSQHEGSERRLQQIERKDKLAKPREAKNTVDPGLEDTVCHLATGVIKLAQLLGATSEDTCEKLGWREACAASGPGSAPYGGPHLAALSAAQAGFDSEAAAAEGSLQCTLALLRQIRRQADSETVREIQARLDELLVRGFEGSKKETSSATQYSPEEGYQQRSQLDPRLAETIQALLQVGQSGAEGLALSKQAHRLVWEAFVRVVVYENASTGISFAQLEQNQIPEIIVSILGMQQSLPSTGSDAGMLRMFCQRERALERGRSPAAQRTAAIPRARLSAGAVRGSEPRTSRLFRGVTEGSLSGRAAFVRFDGLGRFGTCGRLPLPHLPHRPRFYSQLAMIKKNRNATGLFMLSAAVQSEESVDGEGAPENWAWSEELWTGGLSQALSLHKLSSAGNFASSTPADLSSKRIARRLPGRGGALNSMLCVDRHVFEWLYILEEYRGDILDSSLQTLKYLEYEFFASAAHSMSTCLPSRMEFRPMVEMTPAHLETQVEMELAESEDGSTPATGSEAPIVDFSIRLIEKKAKETSADESPVLSVDPLSLSSLLSQGFEEGPARRALRLNNNNTQDAMDWLINGCQEEDKTKLVSEGVRMPTTVHRVLKLKAMKKAQRDKEKFRGSSGRGEKDDDESSPGKPPASPQDSKTRSGAASPDRIAPVAPVRQQPQDLLSMDEAPSAKSNGADSLLLSFDDDQPALPTDFSKPVERTALPAHVEFDLTRCEKPPLASAVAAGVAQPRAGSVTTSSGWPSTDSSQDALAAIQALAAQSGISAEQLLLAAQQLQSGGGERVSSLAASSVPASMQALAPSIAASPFGGYPGTFDLAVGSSPGSFLGRPPEIGLEPSVSDPFGFQQPVAQPSSTESPSKPK
ncbi:unnamed protein product, partial [Polarella glacialis]